MLFFHVFEYCFLMFIQFLPFFGRFLFLLFIPGLSFVFLYITLHFAIFPLQKLCLFWHKFRHIFSKVNWQHIALQILVFSLFNTNFMTKMPKQFLILLFFVRVLYPCLL